MSQYRTFDYSSVVVDSVRWKILNTYQDILQRLYLIPIQKSSTVTRSAVCSCVCTLASPGEP